MASVKSEPILILSYSFPTDLRFPGLCQDDLSLLTHPSPSSVPHSLSMSQGDSSSAREVRENSVKLVGVNWLNFWSQIEPKTYCFRVVRVNGLEWK